MGWVRLGPQGWLGPPYGRGTSPKYGYRAPSMGHPIYGPEYGPSHLWLVPSMPPSMAAFTSIGAVTAKYLRAHFERQVSKCEHNPHTLHELRSKVGSGLGLGRGGVRAGTRVGSGLGELCLRLDKALPLQLAVDLDMQ